MAVLPNTQGIFDKIRDLVIALDIYTTVEQGAVKNWTNADPLCEVMLMQDDSEHFAVNQKIRDTQGFQITSGVSYTKAGITPAVAVANLIVIRDTIIPMCQQRTLLTGLTGVQDSRVKPGSPKISFRTEMGGDSFVIHTFILEVKQLYNVPMGVNYQ
jgi:hypothetical protein